MKNPTDGLYWVMVAIHRAHGLRFVIYTDDHEPAHVHVFGGGGEMKVAIRGAHGLLEMIFAIGIKANDRRRGMDEIRAHQDAFLARWDDIQEGRR